MGFMYSPQGCIEQQPGVKAAQVSIYGWVDEWMDKQNVVCTFDRLLLSLKKEGNFSDTCYNVDEL